MFVVVRCCRCCHSLFVVCCGCARDLLRGVVRSLYPSIDVQYVIVSRCCRWCSWFDSWVFVVFGVVVVIRLSVCSFPNPRVSPKVCLSSRSVVYLSVSFVVAAVAACC